MARAIACVDRREGVRSRGRGESRFSVIILFVLFHAWPSRVERIPRLFSPPSFIADVLLRPAHGLPDDGRLVSSACPT